MKEQIEKYYRENFNRLVKAYRNRCGSVETAEDVIQEAFALALQYQSSYRPEYSNFKAWFDRICLNAFRKRMREDRLLGMSEELDEELIEQDELRLFEMQITDDLKKEMAKKPAHMAEILDLYFIKQYHPRDIQMVTEANYKTIQQTVLRFQQDMKERYKKV